MRMIKTMRVSDIIIKDAFLETTPSKNKMDRCRKFYNKYGKLDKNILVNENNVLLDGYIRYLILKENNVDTAEVEVLGENYSNVNTFYIFGKHPFNKKEYVWRLPNEKMHESSNYQVGGKALVETAYGVKEIQITKTLIAKTPPIKTPIRKIVKYL